MSFHQLSSDGLSIACFLVEHDWEKALGLSVFFPVDITTGLTNRESRRPEAEELLLTLELRVFAEAAEAQAFRHQLATLGAGWVGMPILADQFLGADYGTASARTFDPERLIDLTSPAIVPKTATLTADHVYAPLLVGHITELPPIEPLTGTTSLSSAILTEDSPWAFRCGINATVAPGTWPESILPYWTSHPTQTPVHGLEFERIGFQRERVIDQQERAFVWTCEAEWTLCNKIEIATLLAFFRASRGPYTPFDASLWFTPGTPTAEAPHSTKLRFSDRALKLEFNSSHEAVAKIKFTQVPWEILGTEGETPQQPPRLFLYEITYVVPSPVVWRFTNCWRPLTRTGDGTYNPGPFIHENLSGGLDLRSEKLTLKSFQGNGTNPLDLFNPNVLEGPLWLRVREVETDPIDADAAELVWAGSIPSAPQIGRKYTAECEWLGGMLDREVPAVRYGPGCSTYFFSSRCGHLRSAFEKTGTLASSSDLVVVVTCSDAAAANAYVPGKFEVGSGLTYESRSIAASTPVSGGQQFTLDKPLRQAATGQAVKYLYFCDRRVSTCKALDPTGWKGRFRGEPNAPQVNLSIPQAATTPAGKK